jgi:hypothetical protein
MTISIVSAFLNKALIDLPEAIQMIFNDEAEA